MIKDLILILSGLLCGYFFLKIRQYIIKSGIETVKETVDTTKLQKGLLSVSDKVLWIKDIVSIFNIRKLFIYGLIIGVIFGYGYFKGVKGKPVYFDMRGKEATIQLNDHYLKIEKDGTAKVIDKDGKILKTIRVKDIPELQKSLRPYGFILEPIAVAGLGVGESGVGMEGGAGVSFLKYYKWKLDSFLTNRGIYVGTSYQLTENSGTGLGVGKGFKGDNRILWYWKWRF